MNAQIDDSPVHRDDLTGQLRDPELLHATWAKELDDFESKQVWELRPTDEA